MWRCDGGGCCEGARRWKRRDRGLRRFCLALRAWLSWRAWWQRHVGFRAAQSRYRWQVMKRRRARPARVARCHRQLDPAEPEAVHAAGSGAREPESRAPVHPISVVQRAAREGLLSLQGRPHSEAELRWHRGNRRRCVLLARCRPCSFGRLAPSVAPKVAAFERQQGSSVNYIDDVICTGRTSTLGGREGSARSTDGCLELAPPRPGGCGQRSNSGHLLAAGWSACFIGSMGLAARDAGVALPAGVAVDAEVHLGKSDDGFAFRARPDITLPGLEPPVARVIDVAADLRCPYSNATRGSIAVEVKLA